MNEVKDLYVVVNIGCIECGVSSNIVGYYDDENKATQIAEICSKLFSWREGGQNSFEVFKLGDLNSTDTEYEDTQLAIEAIENVNTTEVSKEEICLN